MLKSIFQLFFYLHHFPKPIQNTSFISTTNAQIMHSTRHKTKTSNFPLRNTNDTLTNKNISFSLSLIKSSKLSHLRQLSTTSQNTMQNRIQVRSSDSSSLKLEEVSFVLLTKNNNNSTYTPARDNRIFATDAGFLKLEIRFKYYSSSLYEATFLSLFLGKGISIIKSQLENNPDYEVNANSTCTNITFLDHFIIENEYTKVIYAEYAPVYLNQSLPPHENDPIQYRPLLNNAIIGNRTHSMAFSSSATFMRFHEEGMRLRERIKIDIKQQQQQKQHYSIITFYFDFIFTPKLDSYEHYYFAILRSKHIDSIDSNDNDNMQWELIACNAYSYDEYEYMVNDCIEINLKDCSYYYKLELYQDKWNTECIDGYLGTSNVVLFPVKTKDNTNENDKDIEPNHKEEVENLNYLPIILCSIIIVIWLIMLCSIGYCSCKIYSIVNKSKQNAKIKEEKEDNGEEMEDDQREESYQSHNCILKHIK